MEDFHLLTLLFFTGTMENDRKLTARLAIEMYEGNISFEDFLMGVPEETNDEEISELIDLITHEPKKGGFMGVSSSKHNKYMAEINKLIVKLSVA